MTHSSFRKAFSLPEVMFAVMILGIGMIMVAAIFPVAIRQAKDTREETTAADVARYAVSTIQTRCATDTTMPDTANLIAIANRSFWYEAVNNLGIRGSVIYPADTSYAWTALYRRNGATSPFAQIFVFVLADQSGQNFSDATDITAGDPNPNLFPRRVEIRGQSNGQMLVRDDTGGGAYPAARGAVADNAYILVEDGTLFRISSFVSTNAAASPVNDTWQLYPGQDANMAPYNTAWNKAWLVGKRRNGANYEGSAQDISFYTTYVKVN